MKLFLIKIRTLVLICGGFISHKHFFSRMSNNFFSRLILSPKRKDIVEWVSKKKCWVLNPRIYYALKQWRRNLSTSLILILLPPLLPSLHMHMYICVCIQIVEGNSLLCNSLSSICMYTLMFDKMLTVFSGIFNAHSSPHLNKRVGATIFDLNLCNGENFFESF